MNMKTQIHQQNSIWSTLWQKICSWLAFPSSQQTTVKNKFVSLISHQLRTPLTSIRWGLERSLNDDTQLSDTTRDELEELHEVTMSMIDSVNTMLMVAKIESLQMKPDFALCDVNSVLSNICENYRMQLEYHQLSLTLNCHEDCSIETDANLLTEIMTNLVNNSIKYTKPSGEIVINCEAKHNSIVIRVEDNGIGIPSEDHATMFKKYYRAENAKLHASEGTGLGLYMVRSLLRMIHGSIVYSARNGGGSVFTVTLPANSSQ